MEKSKQKPRERHCPARGGRTLSLRIRNDGRFDYCVKNTAIPPLGNPTPPAVAEGPLVNGEKTQPPPVATECELLPLGALAVTVREVPLTTVSFGVRGQPVLPPPQEFPLAVARLDPRNQLFDPASYVIWSPPPAPTTVAATAPVVLLRIRKFNERPIVPVLHIAPISVPGPKAMPVGSHWPATPTTSASGYWETPASVVYWTLPPPVSGVRDVTGIPSISPREAVEPGTALLPSLLTNSF